MFLSGRRTRFRQLPCAKPVALVLFPVPIKGRQREEEAILRILRAQIHGEGYQIDPIGIWYHPNSMENSDPVPGTEQR